MSGGLAGRWARLKVMGKGATANHLQERAVASCSKLGVILSEAIHSPHNGSSYPRRRVSSTPRLIDSIIDVSGILDRPPQCAIAHKADDDDRIRLRHLAARCPRFAIS